MTKYTLSDLFYGDYSISQRFGANPTYYRRFGLAGHEGVDFATPVGVRVVCPFEQGIVLRSGFSAKDYGYFLVVWDPKQRCAVWYCHLSRITAGYGSTVKRGQVLGHTGNTGNTSGPHLHAGLVATDAYGNRLNLKNGYQGFLNMLDSNLVTWRLSL